jgi:hypothetical protein
MVPDLSDRPQPHADSRRAEEGGPRGARGFAARMRVPGALSGLLLATLGAAAPVPQSAPSASPPPAASAAASGLALDHVWVMVSPEAPERSALKRAGFEVSPDVSRHAGLGTASASVEFENAYLELMWLDPAVTVAPELQRAAEKYRQRMLWRSSGWCPIGVGLRRTTATDRPLPFPTWSWTAEWMPKGTQMEMLTPRDDTRSPALFIEPRELSDPREQAARASKFHHPNGCRRMTSVRLVSPRSYEPIPVLAYLEEQHVVAVTPGDGWLLEVTFDDGARGKSDTLAPDLPIVVRY